MGYRAAHAVTEGNSLLHGEETVAYADAGYQCIENRPDSKNGVTWNIAMRRRTDVAGLLCESGDVCTHGEGGVVLQCALRVAQVGDLLGTSAPVPAKLAVSARPAMAGLSVGSFAWARVIALRPQSSGSVSFSAIKNVLSSLVDALRCWCAMLSARSGETLNA